MISLEFLALFHLQHSLVTVFVYSHVEVKGNVQEVLSLEQIPYVNVNEQPLEISFSVFFCYCI